MFKVNPDAESLNKKTDNSVPPGAPPQQWGRVHLDKVVEELGHIRRDMLKLEEECAPSIGELHQTYHRSAVNLLHYLALRRHDVRSLQDKLAALGLSSLGRSEAHVMASIDAVLRILCRIAEIPLFEPRNGVISFSDGKALLDQHTESLFGSKPGSRRVRIMVTMPSEAADDYLLVRELLADGMDCMRINCAHDNPAAWERMIKNLRRAKRELGKKCRILMDLGGPKLRTGPVEALPQVIKWRPHRDRFGKVVEPARIWLTPAEGDDRADVPADASLPLPHEWLAGLHAGDVVEFRDTRGAARTLRIVGEVGPSRWGESMQTAYVTSDTTMYRRLSGTKHKMGPREGKVAELPPVEIPILLKKGDTMILTRELCRGKSAHYDQRGKLLSPAMICCTLPEIFSQVRPGERIWLDDGKIGGIIRSVNSGRIKVEITNVRPQGGKLGAEKGINLPDSKLTFSALTGKDIEDLRFIARHANMVGMSFIQDVEDVHKLQALLAELGEPNLGIVLKIETKRGFEMLPDLLLAAMRSHVVGVMIARGDLAVECGYERLAEAQEEILWLCEAAHVPAIWATQVLETLARSGRPSRAEITDAAMGERAECVMLNKGPHIGEAIKALDNILQRMETHQSKKSSMLRQLRWWERAQMLCCVASPAKSKKQ